MTTLHANEETVANFSSDIGGLWCRPIDVLDEPPDSFVFLRDYVSPKVPCILRNTIPSTHGVSSPTNDSLHLTLDDIIERVGEHVKVTVDVTPDGHGDAVRTVECQCCGLERGTASEGNLETQKMFVKPHEQEMSLAEFRVLLRSERADTRSQTSVYHTSARLDGDGFSIYPTQSATSIQNNLNAIRVENPVVYYSRQNDCLRTEMSSLFSTGIVPPTFHFAEKAFDTGPPDAINLWIGNEKSVSSIHKDHYENLFYVCSGQKEFILLPPADIPFVYEDDYDSGVFSPVFEEKSGDMTEASWTIKPDEACDTKARWIGPDIKTYLEGKYNHNQFPLLSNTHPIKILVSQGEMLYIPSLWLHRVTQTTETVGINYWFDMKFDSPHWCYFNLLQQLRRC